MSNQQHTSKKRDKSSVHIENEVSNLLDMIESCITTCTPKLDLSRTTYDGVQILEVSDEHCFIRFTFEGCDLRSDCEAIIRLRYTAQDLKPLRGRIIDERSFRGTVEAFYLVDGKWYYLHPRESSDISAEELLVTQKFMTQRILPELFFNVF